MTYFCIHGLPYDLVQMFPSLRRCAVTLTRVHTSKVKVTRDINMEKCLQETTCIYFWYADVNIWIVERSNYGVMF